MMVRPARGEKRDARAATPDGRIGAERWLARVSAGDATGVLGRNSFPKRAGWCQVCVIVVDVLVCFGEHSCLFVCLRTRDD